MDVVVHGLGDRDHRHALLVEAQSIGQRVVAADGDEDIDSQSLQHLQGVASEIVGTFTFGCLEEVGDRLGSDLAGMGPGTVEDRSAGAVDRPHPGPVHRLGDRCERRRVLRVGVKQTGPSPPETDDLVALRSGPVDNSLDCWVESGDVSTAGKDANSHLCSSQAMSTSSQR